VQASRLLAAELLKVRKRWLPYLLFVVMVGGAAILIWLAGYGSWVGERNDPEYNYGREALNTFVLPGALVALLDVGQYWGAVLVSVLTASVVATEYGWGTVRQSLIRGMTRYQYLALKLAGIILLASVLLLLTLAVGIGFSLIATAIADESASLPSFADTVLMILRAGYCIIPYALFAFLLSIVGRSTTLGVVGTLLFMLVFEPIMIGVLGGLPDPAPHFRPYFIGYGVASLMTANYIDGPTFYSFSFRDQQPASELIDPALGAFVIAVYCVIFLAAAFFVFGRRDLSVESVGG
jgi:ABC-2 type transport system permease protein